MGGWLNTSCIVVLILAIASVRYRAYADGFANANVTVYFFVKVFLTHERRTQTSLYIFWESVPCTSSRRPARRRKRIFVKVFLT